MIEDQLLAKYQEQRRVNANRGIAAMQLAPDIDTYRQIRNGQTVLAKQLEPGAARVALGYRPGGQERVTVTESMLDLVHAAGPQQAVAGEVGAFLARAEAAR